MKWFFCCGLKSQTVPDEAIISIVNIDNPPSNLPSNPPPSHPHSSPPHPSSPLLSSTPPFPPPLPSPSRTPLQDTPPYRPSTHKSSTVYPHTPL